MFFFIAGIQPKTVDMEDHSKMCPSCGLYQARLRRVDHYVSLFFLPVLRVRKGEPLVECLSCGSLSRESGEPWSEPSKDGARVCPECGRHLKSGYRFCPYCGKAL